jgi:hypothetical protein
MFADVRWVGFLLPVEGTSEKVNKLNILKRVAFQVGTKRVSFREKMFLFFYKLDYSLWTPQR